MKLLFYGQVEVYGAQKKTYFGLQISVRILILFAPLKLLLVHGREVFKIFKFCYVDIFTDKKSLDVIDNTADNMVFKVFFCYLVSTLCFFLPSLPYFQQQ